MNNGNDISKLPFIEDQFIDVANLWRVKISRCDVLKNLKMNGRIITFLKTPKGKFNLLGKVKWLGRINDFDCVGIELDEVYKFGIIGKLDKRLKFEAKQKHGVFTPVSNVISVTNYTKEAIPNHLRLSPNIDINSRVKAYYEYSNSWVYGKIVWSGYNDNKEYLYGLELNEPVTNGTDGIFSYQRLFNCKSHLGILVSIDYVESFDTNSADEVDEVIIEENEKYRYIIKMLLENKGDVNKCNQNDETIFDIGMEIMDREFLYSMLDDCKEKLELSLTKRMESILSELVESEKWDLLFQIIENAKVDEISNRYLLFLCISVLRKRNTMELFDEIVLKCPDKNIILNNGETFLTALLKSDIKSSTMECIINRKIFDIDKTNLKKEAPLVLACEFLLVDVVNLLIKLNCDIKLYKNQAIEAAVLAKTKAVTLMDQSKVKDGLKIIELLSDSNDCKDAYLCGICMDKNKNTALNCGHLLCSVCVSKLIQCPFCNVIIQNRLQIFL